MSRLMEVSRRATPFLLKRTPLPSMPPTISSSSHGLAIGSSSLLLDLKPSQNPNSLLEKGGRIRLYSSSLQSSDSNQSSYYMNRLYPRSNSSFKLSGGSALQANVVRLSEEMFLVDSGIGTPRTCLKDELIVGARNKNKIRFENRVGFLDLVSGETPIRLQILERFFVDLIAGDSISKERATTKFNDLVGGSADVNEVTSGEPLLVLPRRYRQRLVSKELEKIWRTNSRVRGFFVGKSKTGYAVAIAGYVAYLPFRPQSHGRGVFSDRFTIESLDLKSGRIVVV